MFSSKANDTHTLYCDNDIYISDTITPLECHLLPIENQLAIAKYIMGCYLLSNLFLELIPISSVSGSHLQVDTSRSG